MNNSKRLFFDALSCKKVQRPPIWLMRQAGRHLPEYRDLRSQQLSFVDMCASAKTTMKLALQPLSRYQLDAAIVFSDILLLPDAMGLGLSFVGKDGPCFRNSIVDLSDVQQMKTPNVYEDLGFVGESLGLLRQHLMGKQAVIGFAGSPWTLACYVVEGKISRQFSHIRQMMYAQPEIVHALIERFTEATIDYLCMQAESGADVLMLFDSHGDLLSPDLYGPFSVHAMQKIIEGVRAQFKDIPFIIYTRSGLCSIKRLAEESDVNCIGISWQIDIAEARRALGDKQIALQGNLDPALLHAPDEQIVKQVQNLMQKHPEPGLIVNLGHGMLPDVSPDKVSVLVDAVHQLEKDTAKA